MFVVFAIETSLAMNQKLDELSILDHCKNSIEHFLKVWTDMLF
jgi:hypothetical protein